MPYPFKRKRQQQAASASAVKKPCRNTQESQRQEEEARLYLEEIREAQYTQVVDWIWDPETVAGEIAEEMASGSASKRHEARRLDNDAMEDAYEGGIREGMDLDMGQQSEGDFCTMDELDLDTSHGTTVAELHYEPSLMKLDITPTTNQTLNGLSQIWTLMLNTICSDEEDETKRMLETSLWNWDPDCRDLKG